MLISLCWADWSRWTAAPRLPLLLLGSRTQWQTSWTAWYSIRSWTCLWLCWASPLWMLWDPMARQQQIHPCLTICFQRARQENRLLIHERCTVRVSCPFIDSEQLPVYIQHFVVLLGHFLYQVCHNSILLFYQHLHFSVEFLYNVGKLHGQLRVPVLRFIHISRNMNWAICSLDIAAQRTSTEWRDLSVCLQLEKRANWFRPI